jgi:hypothetical protein
VEGDAAMSDLLAETFQILDKDGNLGLIVQVLAAFRMFGDIFTVDNRGAVFCVSETQCGTQVGVGYTLSEAIRNAVAILNANGETGYRSSLQRVREFIAAKHAQSEKPAGNDPSNPDSQTGQGVAND